jgi:hypothetical protein
MKIKDQAALEQVRKECRKLVTKRALAAAGASAVPGALVGATADMALLLEVLPKINRKFGLDPEQIDEFDEQTRQQIALLAANVGNAVIGRLITEKLILSVLAKVGVRIGVKSVASWVPLIGSGIAATIGFAAMKAVGNGHIEDCYRIVQQMLESRGTSDGAVAPAAA